MSEKLKTRPVVLEVIGEVAFAQQTLPPGRYMGAQRTPGVRTGGGVQWSEPTYTLKLTAQELDVLGLGLSTTLAYAAQDVTAAVRAGKLVVHL